MTPTCAVAGCNKKTFARGWCQEHYTRWLRQGDPLGGRVSPGAPQRWMEQHAANHRGDECLAWPFGRTEKGYPNLGGRGSATRIMCRLAHGDPPTERHQAAHSCGNGRGGCINPRHLRWATATENAADRVLHGTALIGAQHPCAKLTEAQVREIRALKGTAVQRVIGARFGVTQPTISVIHSNGTWKAS